MIYYRLFDTQTGRYMGTGYNTKSKIKLINEYLEYKKVDLDNEDFEFINKMNINQLINMILIDGFIIEKSSHKFEDIY